MPGVRPCRLVPGVPSPIVGAAERGIDLVVIRESTEGLFASMGKGVVTADEARETLVITRRTCERLFEFSFRYAARRKARGGKGRIACVDKANAFKAYAFFRKLFDQCAARHPDVAADHLYVDACAAMLVRRPWDFDVMVMENMFGDILSDLTAGLIGGMGMAPSADIGDTHAVFQPCHGTAPDIMGRGIANPTAMILSAALMLDWLADRHAHAGAARAARAIEAAVDRAFATGLRPCDLGGGDGTAAIAARGIAGARCLQVTIALPTAAWAVSRDAPPAQIAARKSDHHAITDHQHFMLGQLPIISPTSSVGPFMVDGDAGAWFVVRSL